MINNKLLLCNKKNKILRSHNSLQKNTKWIDTGLNENWKINPLIKTVALCVPSDSDPNLQKSYQNLITFLGEILSNSDLEY